MEQEYFYSVSETDDVENADLPFLKHRRPETSFGPGIYIAFQVLEYALLDAPAAPLKQALLDAGIGEDIMGGYDNGILQPYFTVVGQERQNKSRRENSWRWSREPCGSWPMRGLDGKSLLAGINLL